MPAESAQKIVIANRADGGLVYWLGKLYGFAGIVLIWALGITGVSVYGYFANRAPEPPDLATYSRVAPGVTRIYAGDGMLLGEFASEWREVVPYADIPQGLIDAVLAAEDHEFFEHNGLYFRGIMRAVWANLTSGDFSQGGSTITQQVAKQFLGTEKSINRKALEAIMARRLEARYSKKAILSVYLNQIFLGNGAYGVSAAADRYFSKKLGELDLSEAATIAGLAQAPSRYDPIRYPKAATERRNSILDKMARFGFIEQAEADTWKNKPLVTKPPPEIYPRRLPYYTEHVRVYIADRYKDKGLEQGLTVETAVNPVIDAAAYENVDFGARKQDKRQGWRGPEAYLEGTARETFIERAAELYGDAPLEPGRRYLALVDEVDGRRAMVRIGKQSYTLPLRNMAWAAKWSATNAVNDQVIASPREALAAGNVVWVSAEPRERGRYRDWHLPDGFNPRWQGARTEEELRRQNKELDRTVVLEQVPHPQAAIFTGDHHTSYVLGLVGGYDFNRSEYNRAVQACRQPGSTYKPIYYSAALDAAYGFDTMLDDKPIQVVDPVTGEIWTPTNFGGAVDNQVTLEYALVFSKNLPSVAIFIKVGAKKVEAWARKLGFTTTIIADKALALGASCTVLPELTGAFAVFARAGKATDWVYVRRVFDRDGALLEDHTVPFDPMLPPSDRLDRVAATAGIEPEQAISARTAYLTTKLLARTIEHGFSSILRATGINAAGKTGTSSATMDTAFVAFTSRWITTVWMGDDVRQRPLGKDDAAYMTVEPMWARYMAELGGEHPNLEIPWFLPEGVSAKDRGDHKLGERGPQSDLVYKRAPRAGDEAQPGDG